MTSTKYLTGKPKSYFEPEQSALARKRIKACGALLYEIAERRRNNELEPDDITRYIRAEESIKWWTELLEEE